jgi:hypothetical protein
MEINNNNITSDYRDLQANLYLFASDFETLKAHLAGYSEEGIYSECLEGIREPIANFPAMIESGKLPLAIIAKIFNCYYQMEALSRYPYPTNNVDAFKNNSDWQKVKYLAREIADALEQISA